MQCNQEGGLEVVFWTTIKNDKFSHTNNLITKRFKNDNINVVRLHEITKMLNPFLAILLKLYTWMRHKVLRCNELVTMTNYL